MVHAKPGGARSFEEPPRRQPVFHQLAVAEGSVRETHGDDRALVGRLWRDRRWMSGRSLRRPEVVLALHERGKSRDGLALRDQAPRIVAGAPADIVRLDFDAALADRRRPQEIDGEPGEMGQAIAGGAALDCAADECGGWAGVLMVGMPGAAGQMAGAKHAVADFAIGCVHESLRRCAVPAPVGAGAFLRHAEAWRKMVRI